VWWRRGERPRGLADKRFTFASIFAAIEPGTDNAFALVMPDVNTEAMQLFLDRFDETIGENEHAGWHGAKALAVPGNITLVPLPPHSPELNPVERVWPHLKERFLSHRLHADYDAMPTPHQKRGTASSQKQVTSPHSARTAGSQGSNEWWGGMRRRSQQHICDEVRRAPLYEGR
jgi:DDE superfamily endonuclease